MKGKAVTYEDIVRYLSVKSTKQECESCGQAAWSIDTPITLSNGPATVSLVLASVDSPAGSFNNGGIHHKPMISLECLNCGYTRLYGYNFIKKWLNENPVSE